MKRVGVVIVQGFMVMSWALLRIYGICNLIVWLFLARLVTICMQNRTCMILVHASRFTEPQASPILDATLWI